MNLFKYIKFRKNQLNMGLIIYHHQKIYYHGKKIKVVIQYGVYIKMKLEISKT